jgi:hypothetical protein
MAPSGGIEPHAIHPTLRFGLEDRCRARRRYNYYLSNKLKRLLYPVELRTDIMYYLLC